MKLVVDPKTNQGHYETFDIGEPRAVKKFLEHQAMMRFDDSLPADEKHFSELTDLQIGKVSHQLIWDGKTRVEFALNTASINTGLPNGDTDGRFHYSHLYLNALDDTTFTKLFSSRINLRHVGDIDRDQRFVIETAPQDHTELGNWGFRVWLNPHNGCLPTRLPRLPRESNAATGSLRGWSLPSSPTGPTIILWERLLFWPPASSAVARAATLPVFLFSLFASPSSSPRFLCASNYQPVLWSP